MEELTKQLEQQHAETKGLFLEVKEAEKINSSALAELQEKYAESVKRLDVLEVKAAKPVDSEEARGTLQEELKSNADLASLMKRGRGSVRLDLSAKSAMAIFERKTITSAGVGFSTYGVMAGDRDSAIVAKPAPKPHMLDVIPSRPTTLGEIYWVRETARPTKASPVSEGALKPLVEPTFATDKEPVTTIAILMLASNQVLADWPELEGFLRYEGAARVNEELDLQILSGNGTPPNMNGLITQATAWDLTLLSASDGYEYADILAGARQQVAEANEIEDSPFYVLHPGDAWKIRRTKDSTGLYLFAGPGNGPGPLNLWGATVVETTQITKGTFLYGSGSPMAVEYRSRMGLTIEMSTEDNTNFRYNLVTIRFELRGALVVKRPGAFIHGSLTQSPA